MCRWVSCRLEGHLGALEVAEATTVGRAEATATAATATTTAAAATSTETTTATATATAAASETTTTATAATTTAAAEAAALTGRLSAGEVKTHGTGAAALAEVLAVELAEGGLSLLNRAESNVAEALELAALTVSTLV